MQLIQLNAPFLLPAAPCPVSSVCRAPPLWRPGAAGAGKGGTAAHALKPLYGLLQGGDGPRGLVLVPVLQLVGQLAERHGLVAYLAREFLRDHDWPRPDQVRYRHDAVAEIL